MELVWTFAASAIFVVQIRGWGTLGKTLNKTLRQNLRAHGLILASITLHGLKVNHEPKSSKQTINRFSNGSFNLWNYLTDLEFLEHIENSLINSIYQTSTRTFLLCFSQDFTGIPPLFFIKSSNQCRHPLGIPINRL